MIYKAPFRKFLSQQLIKIFYEYDMYVLLQKKGNSCMIGRFKKPIIRKREFRKISFMDLMVPAERRGRDRSLYSSGTKAPRRLQSQQSLLYGFYGKALYEDMRPSNVEGHHPWTILDSNHCISISALLIFL